MHCRFLEEHPGERQADGAGQEATARSHVSSLPYSNPSSNLLLIDYWVVRKIRVNQWLQGVRVK